MSASSYQIRFARLATALVLILGAAACTADHTPTPRSPSPTQPSSQPSAGASTAAPNGSLAILTCDDGQSSQISTKKAQASGLSSDVWNSSTPVDLKAQQDFSSDGRTFVKSPLMVSPSVKRSTTIRVISPEDAALYYTSWSVWNQQPSPSDLVSTARRDVTVGGCSGTQAQMYPGGYVVGAPSCVTIEVTSPTAQRKIIKAPLGKQCS